MLWVPQKGPLRVEHNAGTVGAANPGTAVTTGASSSTKGAVAQLIAATAFDAYWVRIVAHQYATGSGAAAQGSLDLLIGAAAEQVLIADLLMGYCGGSQPSANIKSWEFPLYIPAGSRLSARAAGIGLSTALRVLIWLYGGNGLPAYRVGQKVTTYGMGTVPNGTPIVPGASGAEGAWTQIVASTAEDHFAIVPSFQPSGETSLNDRGLALDIGVGAATEEEIAQSYLFQTDNNEKCLGPFNDMPTFRDIPAGTRLAMRVSNSSTNDAAYNGVLHAVS